MIVSIQYEAATGTITGMVSGKTAPLEKDLPEGITQKLVAAWTEIEGKEIDLAFPALTLKDRPVKEKEKEPGKEGAPAKDSL